MDVIQAGGHFGQPGSDESGASRYQKSFVAQRFKLVRFSRQRIFTILSDD